MDKLSEILGGARQKLCTGASAHTPPEGFKFYAIDIRVDATEITTLDEVRKKGEAAVTVTDKSWENVSELLAEDYIHFEFPVSSITLKNATDSFWGYCIPYK